MSRLSVLFWALACAALLAVGCSDDTSTGGGDTGADTGVDLSLDTTPDMTPDANSDAAPDAVADVEEDAVVLPEICEPADCTGLQACVGGACVDPIDSQDDYATAAAARDTSYFWSIQLPAVYPEPERCCFDYNGDPAGNPDDGLGALLGLLGSIPGAGDFDIQGTIDATIEDGTITLITDWTELPASGGDTRFSILLASNDIDPADGAPDDPFDAVVDNESVCIAGTRCGGDGSYALDPASFDAYGSQVQFNVGTFEDGVVFAGPSTFLLTIDIPGLGTGPIELELKEAQIEAPITIEADGVHTVDEIRNEGTEDEFFAAGGKLGGVIGAEQIIELLDEQLRACSCAGVDPSVSNPVLVGGVEWDSSARPPDPDASGAFVVECTDNTGNEVNECTGEGVGDGPLCPQIATICGFAGFIGNVLDVDIDPVDGIDGINDSLSAGLRFAWTGAAVDGLVPTPTE